MCGRIGSAGRLPQPDAIMPNKPPLFATQLPMCHRCAQANSGTDGESTMSGSLAESDRYLRLAVEHYERAESSDNPQLQAKFREIAARDRDLALKMLEHPTAQDTEPRAKQK
jgi:hypothetical protein